MIYDYNVVIIPGSWSCMIIVLKSMSIPNNYCNFRSEDSIIAFCSSYSLLFKIPFSKGDFNSCS